MQTVASAKSMAILGSAKENVARGAYSASAPENSISIYCVEIFTTFENRREDGKVLRSTDARIE
jgi:hypothetical protein